MPSVAKGEPTVPQTTAAAAAAVAMALPMPTMDWREEAGRKKAPVPAARGKAPNLSGASAKQQNIYRSAAAPPQRARAAPPRVRRDGPRPPETDGRTATDR